MKKLIVVAAAVLAGSPAFASKARVNALGNSRQLVDVQYTFERPYLLHSVGEMATIEWGAKDPAGTNPKAEGGVIKKHEDMVYGLYLGKQGLLSSEASKAANTALGLLAEQNPINVLFGMKTGEIAWGLNLSYSNGKNDTTNDLKTSSTGLTLGATMGDWEAEIGSSLAGKAEDSTDKDTVEVKGDMKLGVGYNISEQQHAYLTYGTNKVDTTTAGGTAVTTEKTVMELGYINTLVKSEDANFFYGVAYSSNKIKDGDETTTLPLWIGVEATATSWMTMRASVKQSVLINEVKNAAGKKQDLDSIAFAAGAGFKLGKGMLDASFGTANEGHLSFNDGAATKFLGNVSYTYMF